VVVTGTAIVTRGEDEFQLRENESTFLPAGTIHRLSNPGQVELHMIEVQSGEYVGEDDIVRIADNYGRSGEGDAPPRKIAKPAKAVAKAAAKVKTAVKKARRKLRRKADPSAAARRRVRRRVVRPPAPLASRRKVSPKAPPDKTPPKKPLGPRKGPSTARRTKPSKRK
jgi:hypothetical protein